MRRLILIVILTASAALAARQYYLPGVGYINETGTRQYMIPESTYTNETSGASGPPAGILNNPLVMCGGPRAFPTTQGYLNGD